MADTSDHQLLAAARELAETLERMNEENENRPSVRAKLERSIDSLDRQISRYVASDQRLWSHPSDSSAFLDSVDELIFTIRDWKPLAGDKSVAVCLTRADDLLQQAIFRLQDEFKSLMELADQHLFGDDADADADADDDDDDNDGGQILVAEPISSDYTVLIDVFPSATIKDLNEMVNRMVAAGFEKECSHVYGEFRRKFLEESLSRLRLQNLSVDEVHAMPWQDLEDEIDRWIRAVNFAVRTLFPSERLICDRVFSGLYTADFSFMEVCRAATTQLLNFADAVAIGSRSPERLFKVIDLFETMGDLMPHLETLFSDQYCSILLNEVIAIKKRLGEAIRGILMELENLIGRDPAKTAVPGGSIHPITRYVMNYLRVACNSRQALEQVFEENVNSKDSASTLSVQMGWFLELLESNLDAKSKVYGDPGLCFLFMMNNGRYILQKVKDSELRSILGDDWVHKYSVKLRQYHSNYRRSSWNQIIGVLKLDDHASSAKTMKEKLKLFNSYFEEICKTQSTWVVLDEKLREELRVSVARLVLPTYGNFVGRFKNLPEMGKHPDKHIRYRVEDVEMRINELFQGTAASASGRN